MRAATGRALSPLRASGAARAPTRGLRRPPQQQAAVVRQVVLYFSNNTQYTIALFCSEAEGCTNILSSRASAAHTPRQHERLGVLHTHHPAYLKERKLRGAEPAKVPVRCQPVEEATTSRRRRTLGIDVSVRRDTRLSTPAALPADSRDRNAEGVALRRGPGPNAVQRPLPAGRWTPIETAKSIREDSPQPRGCETRLLPGEAPHVLTAIRMQPHTRPQREPERQCAQQVWARVCRPQVV